MKRYSIIALLLAACLTAAGCSGNTQEPWAPESSAVGTEPAEATTSAADTTAAPASTEETAERSTFPETTAAKDETAVQSSAESGTAPRTEAGLLKALLRRISDPDGAVYISYEMEENGLALSGTQLTYGKCFSMEMNNAGTVLHVCSDGSTSWMLHEPTASYSVMSAQSTQGLKPEGLIEQINKLDQTILGSGTDSFRGKAFRYEDYLSPGGEDGSAAQETVRYFFDDNGGLLGIRAMTGESAGLEYVYEIRIEPSPDMSLFAPPAGYTEITELEMTQRVFGDMFGSAFSGLAE